MGPWYNGDAVCYIGSMPYGTPDLDDVIDFLYKNPEEVEQLRFKIHAIKEEAKRKAEYAEKRKNAKMVPCGNYGCTAPKNEFDVFCPSCYEDYKEDPDAYK